MNKNKSRRTWVLLVMACSALAYENAPAFAQQQVSRVLALSVGEVNGTAEILSKRAAEKSEGSAQILTQSWKALSRQVNINVGDQLRTGGNSSLKLNLNDGTVLTLAGETLLVVEKLQSAKEGQTRVAEFRLEKGTVSTLQTAKILGQTAQVIRTNNGVIDTQLGEVEITKPQSGYSTVMAADSDQSIWPFGKQRAGDADQTVVNVLRGTAQVQSAGQGSMITTSTVLPDTCLGEDGVQFTLNAPKAQVKIAKLPDINGFELSSVQPFQLLIGTEGQANRVKLFNRKGVGEIDIEGIGIAEQDDNSTLNLALSSLLTVGMKSSEMTVSLACSSTESKGLDFQVLGMDGQVSMLRDTLGGRRETISSRGAMVAATATPRPPIETPTPIPVYPEGERTPRPRPTVTPVPGGPTPGGPTPTPGGPTPTPGGPTPTPIPGEPTPTSTPEIPVTPTKTVGPRPTPVPTKIPVTHTFPRNPRILVSAEGGLNAPDIKLGGTCGIGGKSVIVTFGFFNYLPNLMPGKLSSYITDSSWHPYAPGLHTIIEGANVQVLNYTYTNDTQLETGYIRYWFCYNNPPALYFYVTIFDREGNASNRMRCSSPNINASPMAYSCQ